MKLLPMRIPVLLLFLLSMVSALSSCGGNDSEITIAAAANTQFLMEELIAAFEAETGIKADLTTGSSGKLSAQIKNGAPYDLFFSADTKYPEALFQEGFVAEGPANYAVGKLVVWTMKDIPVDDGLSSLTANAVKKVAIANPETAPYGLASVEALKRSGLYEIVEPKLVYGESISQVNQYISTQSADIGITALAVVAAGKMKGKGRFKEVNQSFHDPLEQAMVLLRHGAKEHGEASRRFWDFMQGKIASDIIRSHGYEAPAQK